jgi:hypothetical protein
MNTITDILRKVSQLNGADRTKLLQQMKAYVANGGNSAQEDPDDADINMALRCVCDVMKDLGFDTFVNRHRRHPGYRAFADKVPAVLVFIRRTSSHRVVHQTVLKFGLRLLYQELMRAGYPVSVVTMMAHFHRVPSIINRSLPGYVQSGLLGAIFEEQHHARSERSRKRVSV